MVRVAVTGMGVVSAIGMDQSQTLTSLRAGRSGIGQSKFLQSKHADSFPLAEVPCSNEQLMDLLGLSTQEHFTRTDLLAFHALRQAIVQADWQAEQLQDPGTALLSATTVGGMCETEAIYADTTTGNTATPYIHHYRNGAHTASLAKAHGMVGYVDTMNTACSSSANAIMNGVRLLRTGRAKRAVVGGVESLAAYTVNGFNALQILSRQATRPFDQHRDGLTLGEGAAYLVLEKMDSCDAEKVLAEVSGYGNANDAYHASAMSAEANGVTGAITAALKVADLRPEDISMVNTHGTGTENNDATELFGMTKIFGKVPPFISTKAYTGHTLAAAGALEAVFSILAVQQQEIHPSLNCTEPMVGADSLHRGSTTTAPIEHVLSNSFGFGGNCSSLILSAP